MTVMLLPTMLAILRGEKLQTGESVSKYIHFRKLCKSHEGSKKKLKNDDLLSPFVLGFHTLRRFVLKIQTILSHKSIFIFSFEFEL